MSRGWYTVHRILCYHRPELWIYLLWKMAAWWHCWFGGRGLSGGGVWTRLKTSRCASLVYYVDTNTHNWHKPVVHTNRYDNPSVISWPLFFSIMVSLVWNLVTHSSFCNILLLDLATQYVRMSRKVSFITKCLSYLHIDHMGQTKSESTNPTIYII